MKQNGKPMKPGQPTAAGTSFPTTPERRVPIRFEDHVWPVEIRATETATEILKSLETLSPGACSAADNPGGLSHVPCAPRRLYRFKR
jgi:hypothetical protein